MTAVHDFGAEKSARCKWVLEVGTSVQTIWVPLVTSSVATTEPVPSH